MNQALLEWRSYNYFPYEREFARMEITKLLRTSPTEDPKGMRIPAADFCANEIARLTYIDRAIHPNGTIVVPRQTELESSANGKTRDRQATRYSAHGLHEYKGKFNPQVVRAIGNMLGLGDEAWVLDPFCGSGTTLLECAHTGWNAIGIDQNPLAIRISNAKLRAIRQRPTALTSKADRIQDHLQTYSRLACTDKMVSKHLMTRLLGRAWLDDMPCVSYLKSWFNEPVLAQIAAILRTVESETREPADRRVFEVVLSDLLRGVSLQDPGDLRVRRRKDARPNYALVEMYCEAISERIERIGRARKALGKVGGKQSAILGDARTLRPTEIRGVPPEGFEAIISSPPYETALPYVDTQRLSLVLFGLIGSTEVSATEASLIGAREISTKTRLELEAEIVSRPRCLPKPVLDLCCELLAAAGKQGNGFRRVNKPALTYRYFRDMSIFFANALSLLRPGAPVALVVGKNRTVLGGTEFVIDTPRLLVELARHHGYSLAQTWSMDTYPRFDLHRKNSIDSETLIVVTTPG